MIMLPWLEPLIKWAKNYAKPYNVWFYWIGVLVCGTLGGMSLIIWRRDGFTEAKGIMMITGVYWMTWLTVGQIGRLRKSKLDK